MMSDYERGVLDGVMATLNDLGTCANDIVAAAELALAAGNMDAAMQRTAAARGIRDFLSVALGALEARKNQRSS